MGKDPAARLGRIIERELDGLRRGVEVLVWRAGLTRERAAVADAADDVLQDVVERALRRAEVFDPSRSAHAWLFGIAVNVVKERRRQAVTDARRRGPDSEPAPTDETAPTSDDERISRAYAQVVAGPRDALVELLDLVGPGDREVLRCAFVEQLRGPELAAALGVKEGAARVRVSRAVGRLAVAYRQAEQAGAQG